MRKLKNAEKMLYALVNPQSSIAESFRILRTNINLHLKECPQKTILLTSPGVGDGTSAITTNLGVVMAQAGNRVLVIDSDLRRPETHIFFNKNNDYGLSNLLMQEVNPKNVIQETVMYGLWHLSSGPMLLNPADLLGSEKMISFLCEAREYYNIILLNAPPVLGVTDTALLAPMADGVILVVKAGSTNIESVRDAKGQLERLNSNIIGVVLNEVIMKRKDLQYYYYHEKRNLLQGNHTQIPQLPPFKDVSEAGSRQNTTEKKRMLPHE